MTEAYWAVAQTFSGMENLVRRDIEEAGIGAFLPAYTVTLVRRWRKIEARRPLMPGYVFFQTSPGEAGPCSIKGVHQVLSDADDVPLRVHPLVMHRLMLENASGVHNRIEAAGHSLGPSRRNRSRKPRRSKRARIPTHP